MAVAAAVEGVLRRFRWANESIQNRGVLMSTVRQEALGATDFGEHRRNNPHLAAYDTHNGTTRPGEDAAREAASRCSGGAAAILVALAVLMADVAALEGRSQQV